MARKLENKFLEIKDKVNDLYFVKQMSIKNVCKVLKCSNTNANLAIETIYRERLENKKNGVSEISDEQVIKQNAFIEKHMLIRDRFADAILITTSDAVRLAYNKMTNNNFKTINL